MQTLPTWTTGEHPCEYLRDRLARTEYVFALEMSAAEYEERMNSGWRKFGRLLFRPVCRTCDECRALRIPVDDFTPNRSRARTLKQNADLVVKFGAPECDPVRLDLYNRYHEAQEVLRGWSESVKEPEEYEFAFVDNPVPGVEISVWEGTALRAVVLVDVTPTIVSAVYHYYDPELRDRGIGTFALLQTFALARRLGKPYVHFGYYVADCPSLSYKATFQPCQILGADRVWREEPGKMATPRF